MSFVDVRDCAAQHVAAMEMEDKKGRFMSHLVVFSQQEGLEIWSCFLGSGAMLLAIGRSMEESSTVGEIKLAQMTMPQASWHWMPLHVYDSNDQFVDE